MTGAEHILAWIESSREHYESLLRLEQSRKGGASHSLTAARATLIATDAYREMTRGGGAYTSDHSPRTILEAAILLAQWELEE